jgi:hypothetical protein
MYKFIPNQQELFKQYAHSNNGHADIISAHCYCDMVTFILKWTPKSHPCYIFYILYMLKNLRR